MKPFFTRLHAAFQGTWEFVCHPGYNDADLQAARTRLRQSRETELRVLTLPAARAVLQEEGIELISYQDLETTGHACGSATEPVASPRVVR